MYIDTERLLAFSPSSLSWSPAGDYFCEACTFIAAGYREARNHLEDEPDHRLWHCGTYVEFGESILVPTGVFIYRRDDEERSIGNRQVSLVNLPEVVARLSGKPPSEPGLAHLQYYRSSPAPSRASA